MFAASQLDSWLTQSKLVFTVSSVSIFDAQEHASVCILASSTMTKGKFGFQ